MAEIGVIHTEHIKKYYIMGDVEVRALNDISLDIYKGELTAIMGPSGSGKSTLMNILGCLDRPTGGLYMLGGEEVSRMNDSQLADVRNRKIGFVFQSFNLLSRSTALENVLLPTLYSKNKANAKQRALNVLEMVGLGARVNHKPKEMSGGQQQRVAIARALINDPEIIMADEPTGNLDSKSGKEIMELLIRLNKEQGKTIILVTHDPKIGKQVPRVISVFDGMLGSEEEQRELKRWTDVNFSKLEGLSGDKAALGDDEPQKGSADVSHETKIPEEEEKDEGEDEVTEEMTSPDDEEPRRVRRRSSRRPQNPEEEDKGEGGDEITEEMTAAYDEEPRRVRRRASRRPQNTEVEDKSEGGDEITDEMTAADDEEPRRVRRRSSRRPRNTEDDVESENEE